MRFGNPVSLSETRSALFSTRTALLLGFGGLLLLLLFSGLDAVQVLSKMRSSNEQIRGQFLARARMLELIRSSVYLSGTYVRDYLLEPDPAKADRNRASLTATRQNIQADLESYERLMRPGQREPFAILQRELEAYWRSLEPVLNWDAAHRRADGYAFLRDEVFPRRTNMLSIADKIGAVNEQELTEGDRLLSDMFVNLRNRLVTVLGVTILLGLVQAAASMRQILRLERATERHLDESTEAQTKLRDLSARLVNAQEEERKSISRELHDAVGQSLSAVLLELRNLAALLPERPAELRSRAASLGRLIETTVGMVRNMALLLRPSMLDDLGLVPALEWQARDVSKRTGLTIKVHAGELPDELPDEHKTCIYRIVQEALHNAARHAEAHTIVIAVQQHDGKLEMSVEDDGRGLSAGEQSGLGLIGMRERAENLGGTLQIESKSGAGTLIKLSLPVPSTKAASA